jgi:hypothetical protein
MALCPPFDSDVYHKGNHLKQRDGNPLRRAGQAENLLDRRPPLNGASALSSLPTVEEGTTVLAKRIPAGFGAHDEPWAGVICQPKSRHSRFVQAYGRGLVLEIQTSV